MFPSAQIISNYVAFHFFFSLSVLDESYFRNVLYAQIHIYIFYISKLGAYYIVCAILENLPGINCAEKSIFICADIFVSFMEFIILETNRGKKCLLHDVYVYRPDAVLKNQDSSWKCSNKNCRARVKTNHDGSTI